MPAYNNIQPIFCGIYYNRINYAKSFYGFFKVFIFFFILLNFDERRRDPASLSMSLDSSSSPLPFTNSPVATRSERGNSPSLFENGIFSSSPSRQTESQKAVLGKPQPVFYTSLLGKRVMAPRVSDAFQTSRNANVNWGFLVPFASGFLAILFFLWFFLRKPSAYLFLQ